MHEQVFVLSYKVVHVFSIWQRQVRVFSTNQEIWSAKKSKTKQANNQSVNINLQGWLYYANKKIKIYFKKIIETSRASTERCCRQLLLQFLAGFKKRSNNRDVLLKFSHRREEDVQDDEEEKEEETLTH